MEPIPSNTTHLLNFPFLPIWGVFNGIEHINNTLTILSRFFLLFFFKIQTTSLFFFVLSFSISNGSSNTTKQKIVVGYVVYPYNGKASISIKQYTGLFLVNFMLLYVECKQ